MMNKINKHLMLEIPPHTQHECLTLNMYCIPESFKTNI